MVQNMTKKILNKNYNELVLLSKNIYCHGLKITIYAYKLYTYLISY